jgi:hypothetical protein
MIKNVKNGKKYVGESVDIDRRWKEHQRQLAKGRHHCKRLQQEYNRYGKGAFTYKVLERFYFTKGCNADKVKIALLLREGFWTDVLNAGLDYNTEDSIGDLKKLADSGSGNPKFYKYKPYRKFIQKNICYAKYWFPHFMVAGLYNPLVKISLILGGVMICFLLCLLLCTDYSFMDIIDIAKENIKIMLN